MLADLRHSWRSLRRTPGYFAAAVLTLALGIGATTALFGVVDRVLLRPLPYRDPGRLVRVWNTGIADGLLVALRERSRSYAAVAGFGYPGDVTVLAGGAAGRPSPSRARASAVTGNLFDVLGTPAALGRALRPNDGAPHAPPVAVVSDAYWREQLDADPRAVGRTIAVDGAPHQVVGVMPPAFHFPAANIALWTAAHLDPSNRAQYWWQWRLNAIARLAGDRRGGRAA